MIWELPKTILLGGEEWDIRTDFRDVLKIVIAFGDPNLENEEKIYICLQILYEGFDEIPEEQYEAAFTAALNFIDCEMPENQKNGKLSPRTMDWEQDSNILFAAVNKIAGYEVRSVNYLHWWSFIGYFMEIPADGVFGNILRLRQKKAKGKLDKSEREFWAANRSLCELKPKLSDKEKAAKERLKQMLK